MVERAKVFNRCAVRKTVSLVGSGGSVLEGAGGGCCCCCGCCGSSRKEEANLLVDAMVDEGGATVAGVGEGEERAEAGGADAKDVDPDTIEL